MNGKSTEGQQPKDGAISIITGPDRVLVHLMPRRRVLKIVAHLAIAFAVGVLIICRARSGMHNAGTSRAIYDAISGFALVLACVIGFMVYNLMSTTAVLTAKELVICRSFWKWNWRTVIPASRILRVNVGDVHWAAPGQYINPLEGGLHAVNFELKDGSFHRYIASDRTPEEKEMIARSLDSFLKLHRANGHGHMSWDDTRQAPS